LNCEPSGDCSGDIGGIIGAKDESASSACVSHYPGQIGSSTSSASSACVSGSPGSIGAGAVICEAPTAPTNLTASAATVCKNTPVTLTATGGSVGSGAQFEWGTGAVGSGTTLKTASNVYTASPTTTTTYWVRRVSTVGCAASGAVTLTVETTTCSGGGTGTASTCPDYSTGFIGSSGTAGEAPSAVCMSNAPGQIGSSTSSASSACVSGSPGSIGAGMVICEAPTAPTSFTASASTVCIGAPVTLTATGGSVGFGAQFEWGTGAVGSGTTLKTASNSYTASPTTTTTYWVRRVSTVGCGASGAVTLTVETTNCFDPSAACPGIIPGQVGATDDMLPVGGACASHYSGQIGGTATAQACTIYYPGRIGQ
jgi:hypothetical protein